jgi:Delta7-sterol 5-desaturase
MDFWHYLQQAPWGDSQSWHWILGLFAGNLLKESIFYGVSASVMWGLLHGVLRRRLAHRLIAQWPSSADVRREIRYSLSTVLVFASVGVVVTAAVLTGHIAVYFQARQYGWTWLIVSLPLLVLWHDFYFYLSHRLLHTRWWFRHVHGVHHRSRHPSPWAAYAFHPVEALINAMVLPLAMVVVPLHVSVLLAFMLHQIVRNTHGHAAVETMPAGFTKHRFWRHFTTTTHHHLHHETATGNYGLWFTWWDRWLGTENPRYLQRFTATHAPAKPEPTQLHPQEARAS